MIISRTPYRISLLGGGTDYPAWYLKHGGAVLAASIDKYCYLTCRYLPPFFEHRIRVVYSKIETVQTVDEISHPAIRECLRYLNISRGLEIHHDGDLPARSGMGSSSSFTVGLLHALYALRGQMPSKQQLAQESIDIEQNCLKETVGSQDQISVAYGGLNHIVFRPSGFFEVRPVTISSSRINELDSHLMLFYTGIERTASQIAGTYVPEMDHLRRELRIIRDLVDEGLQILSDSGPIAALGDLLHEAWMAKKRLSGSVSNESVDELYERARSRGAIGGKLTGAGGGGFLLLFVPPDRQPAMMDEFSHLIHVPFKMESSGSQIIFIDREEDCSVQDMARIEKCT